MEQKPELPPANADEWSDEQWIDWLKTTDTDASPTDEGSQVKSLERIARSTGGQVLGSAMVGLAQAIYGHPEERPAIVAEAGEPETDQALELHLDFDQPDRSFVVLKHDPEWLPRSEP